MNGSSALAACMNFREHGTHPFQKILSPDYSGVGYMSKMLQLYSNTRKEVVSSKSSMNLNTGTGRI
jgi:hypothetical protein